MRNFQKLGMVWGWLRYSFKALFTGSSILALLYLSIFNSGCVFWYGDSHHPLQVHFSSLSRLIWISLFAWLFSYFGTMFLELKNWACNINCYWIVIGSGLHCFGLWFVMIFPSPAWFVSIVSLVWICRLWL